jgi:WD40 repeat protein
LLVAPQSSQGQEDRIPGEFLRPQLVLNSYHGHMSPVRALAFSPDGKYLLSGGEDKIVHVWEFRDGRARLDGSIRPPLYRLGGAIYALAISPKPDPEAGHYLVAVAGRDPIGNGGDILVYRLFGPKDAGTGDLAFVLPQDGRRRNGDATGAGAPEPGAADAVGTPMPGHWGPVFGLSFSPDGRYLASCGQDTTIRVWDLGAEGHPVVHVLRGHAGSVERVLFADADRLVSAGGEQDGTVRIWDWRNDRQAPGYTPVAKDVQANQGRSVRVSAMAISPDGRFVIDGRENGRAEIIDTTDPRDPRPLNPLDRPRRPIETLLFYVGSGAVPSAFQYHLRRPVEAMAYSPDGQWLAASMLRDRPQQNSEMPRTECEITLRRMPAGDQVRVVHISGDRVLALAFSPDSRFLAALGGNTQELTVHAIGAVGDAPAFESRGPGTALWDVGFIPDATSNPTIAYARNRPMGREAKLWEGFDFRGRRFVPVARPDELRRARVSFDGWTVRPDARDPLRLEATGPAGERVPLALEAVNGRWTSYSLIPPSAESRHPGLAVAIGCRDGMVVIHGLPDGKKTREYLGHSGAVYAVAPSPDGRWLVSASADQTLGLWALAGCDTRPGLGARIERDAQGSWIVKQVDARGFAEQMGVKVGDRVTSVRKQRGDQWDDLPAERLEAELEAVAPGEHAKLKLEVARGAAGAALEFQTTRRDQPALRLLAATNGEWILWMPEGYYDTSIAGDRRLLGWHLNKVVPGNGRIDILPSEFYPMSRYERVLLRRRVIDELLATGDPIAALRLAQNVAPVQPPATIRVRDPNGALVEGVLLAQQPELTLQIEAQGASAERSVASIRVRNNQVPNPEVTFPLPPPPVQALPETVRLWPGDNPISIEAVDDLGVVGRRDVLVRYQPPAEPSPPRSASRMLIRSVGIETFQNAGISRIEYADRDAESLAAFLKTRGESNRFDRDRIELRVLNARRPDADVSSRGIQQVFDQLKVEAQRGNLQAGDTVFLMLESYVLDFGEGSLVLGSDARLPGTAQAAIRTDAISEDLKYVTETGCLVLLFLDGVHDELPLQTQRNLTDWVRTLQKHGVMVLMASKQEKSLRGDRLSVFVQAVLDSIKVRGAGRAAPSPTLDDFQGIVIRGVEEATGRIQKADFYHPDHIQPRLIRIFEPQPRPSAELASVRTSGRGR